MSKTKLLWVYLWGHWESLRHFAVAQCKHFIPQCKLLLPVYPVLQVHDEHEFAKLSETNFHQELPTIGDDYIIPTEYYDKYRLVFSHYHLDKIFVRIGMNAKQRRAAQGAITQSDRPVKAVYDSWYSVGLSRKGDRVQEQPIIACKVPASQNLLN